MGAGRRLWPAAAATVTAGAGLLIHRWARAALSEREARARARAIASPPTSRRARGAEVAMLASRVGGSYATHRARRVFASEERRQELDMRMQMKTADEVTR